jgi:hypothetical protein
VRAGSNAAAPLRSHGLLVASAHEQRRHGDACEDREHGGDGAVAAHMRGSAPRRRILTPARRRWPQ